ncbi:unnamed protein product [Thelazia callipaeda]|uniref:Cytoplasmic tRNA 2-thiolation protein 2 n=1 Tax=Thelazia callipaeda TaxID=103827 RepID=A0A0N5CZ11_THECL|nr:unnamed protein product [Thelazia callipaeda]
MSEGRKCIKCPEKATLCSTDVKQAVYCKSCFILMVKHKFRSTIGKRRLYKDGEKRETLVIYDGTNAGAFLLSVISEDLQVNKHKRLALVPTVMVLMKEVNKEKIDIIKRDLEVIKECIKTPWIYVHIAAIFDSTFEPQTSSDICGIEYFIALQISDWIRLLASCSSLSIREEIECLCTNILCVRIARKLQIDKVMLPLSADVLAAKTLSSLAFARGPSVFHIANVIDKRYGVKLIRPLREISEKEMGLVNRFEGSDKYILNFESCRVDVNADRQSLQSVSRYFINTLVADGFTGTVTTILSTVNKVQGPARNINRCPLCASTFSSDGSQRSLYCFSCSSLLDEVGNKVLLEKLLNCINVDIM